MLKDLEARSYHRMLTVAVDAEAAGTLSARG
jgi:hypothetical protein